MMKIAVTLLVLFFVASVSAKSKVAERIQQKADTTAVAADATQQVAATALNSGDCAGGNDPCANGGSTIVAGGGFGGGFGGEGGDGMGYKEMKERELANLGPRPRVEEALRPIDDWINDFTKRSQLQGSLWEAARATVQPLLRKLRKSQEDAIDRLRVSNRAIRDNVEDAATEHVYNLLKSKRAIEDAEVAASGKKAQLSSAKAALQSAKEAEESAKEGAKQMAETIKKEKALEAEARKKAGMPPSKDNTSSTILDNINKILGSK